MHRYIIKRIVLIIPVIFLVSFIVYALLDMAPGDLATIMAPEDMSDEEIEVLRESLGLNDPLIVRYARYMGNVLRGDLGRSMTDNTDILAQFMVRFPNTIKLAFLSGIVTVVIAVPMGIIAARKQNSWIDAGATTFSLLGLSIPNFWLGLMCILLFGVQLKLLPVSGADTWKHFIMPAFVVGTGDAAILARTTRSAMLDVLRQDYLRTARAKGCSERTVVNKHALRNALIPISTIAVNILASSFAGACLTESVFSLPGIGQLTVQSVRNTDYTTAVGCCILTTFVVTISMLLLDIAIAYIDPRIKAQYSK